MSSDLKPYFKQDITFKDIDLFSEPLNFRYQGGRYFKTECGGIATVIILILVSLIISMVFYEALTVSPKSVTSLTYIEEEYTVMKNISGIVSNAGLPNAISRNLTQLPFSFGVVVGDAQSYFYDETYFSLSVDQLTFIEEDVYEANRLSFSKCESFAELDASNFSLLHIESHFCINDNYTLNGFHGNPLAKVLRIQFNLCKGKKECKSFSEIQSLFQTNSVQMILYYDDQFINIEWYDEPIMSKLISSYIILDLGMTKSVEMEIRIDKFINKLNLIPSFGVQDDYEESYFTKVMNYNERYHITDSDYYSSPTSTNPLLEIFVMKNRVKTMVTTKRYYQDIVTSLALVGGCTIFFSSIIYAIISRLIRFELALSLANSIYNVVDPTKEKAILQDYETYLVNHYYFQVANYIYDNRKILTQIDKEIQEDQLDKKKNDHKVFGGWLPGLKKKFIVDDGEGEESIPRDTEEKNEEKKSESTHTSQNYQNIIDKLNDTADFHRAVRHMSLPSHSKDNESFEENEDESKLELSVLMKNQLPKMMVPGDLNDSVSVISVDSQNKNIKNCYKNVNLYKFVKFEKEEIGVDELVDIDDVIMDDRKYNNNVKDMLKNLSDKTSMEREFAMRTKMKKTKELNMIEEKKKIEKVNEEDIMYGFECVPNKIYSLTKRPEAISPKNIDKTKKNVSSLKKNKSFNKTKTLNYKDSTTTSNMYSSKFECEVESNIFTLRESTRKGYVNSINEKDKNEEEDAYDAEYIDRTVTSREPDVFDVNERDLESDWNPRITTGSTPSVKSNERRMPFKFEKQSYDIDNNPAKKSQAIRVVDEESNSKEVIIDNKDKENNNKSSHVFNLLSRGEGNKHLDKPAFKIQHKKEKGFELGFETHYIPVYFEGGEEAIPTEAGETGIANNEKTKEEVERTTNRLLNDFSINQGFGVRKEKAVKDNYSTMINPRKDAEDADAMPKKKLKTKKVFDRKDRRHVKSIREKELRVKINEDYKDFQNETKKVEMDFINILESKVHELEGGDIMGNYLNMGKIEDIYDLTIKDRNRCIIENKLFDLYYIVDSQKDEEKEYKANNADVINYLKNLDPEDERNENLKRKIIVQEIIHKLKKMDFFKYITKNKAKTYKYYQEKVVYSVHKILSNDKIAFSFREKLLALCCFPCIKFRNRRKIREVWNRLMFVKNDYSEKDLADVLEDDELYLLEKRTHLLNSTQIKIGLDYELLDFLNKIDTFENFKTLFLDDHQKHLLSLSQQVFMYNSDEDKRQNEDSNSSVSTTLYDKSNGLNEEIIEAETNEQRKDIMKIIFMVKLLRSFVANGVFSLYEKRLLKDMGLSVDDVYNYENCVKKYYKKKKKSFVFKNIIGKDADQQERKYTEESSKKSVSLEDINMVENSFSEEEEGEQQNEFTEEPLAIL